MEVLDFESSKISRNPLIDIRVLVCELQIIIIRFSLAI